VRADAGRGPTPGGVRYSAFIGHLHLARGTPELLTRNVGSIPRYADELIETLVAPTR
jgi:hypothetical protein